MDSQNKEHTLKKVMVLGAVAVVLVVFANVNLNNKMQQSATAFRNETAQTAMNLLANPAIDMSMVGKTTYLPVEDETGLVEESISAKTKIVIKKVSSASVLIDGGGNNDDTGLYKIVYDITPVNGDVYVPIGTVSNDINFSVQQNINGNIMNLANLNGVTTIVSSIYNCTATVKDNCMVYEGDTQRFAFTTLIQLPNVGNAGLYRVVMNGLSWGKTDLAQLNINKTFMYPYKTTWMYLN